METNEYEEQLKLDAKENFKAELKQAGISNDNAIEDIMNRATFHVIEFQGEKRAYIRNSDGKVIDSESLINTFKKDLPSYFQSYSTNDTTGNLSEHYAIDILKEIESGQIKKLNDEQRATLKKVFSELQKIDYTPGANQKRNIGKYDYMKIYRLCKKAGGLQ